jgi:two-component system, NarL family, nitrate/nitrite sensor histidine kinase NarX
MRGILSNLQDRTNSLDQTFGLHGYLAYIKRHIFEFMSKKINSLRNSSHTDFSWDSDFHFTPPQKGGGSSSNKLPEPAVSRAGDLKPAVEKLLETLIGTVNASFAVARIFPAHGKAHQLISSVGLPPELLELGSSIDLNCDVCGKASIRGRIYFADINTCKTRQDCRYAQCKLKSIIITSLENHSSPQKPAGTITLFFNTSPKPVDRVSKTVMAFADLLGILIEHYKSNREARRIELIAERQAIANEIHDSLAQTLVYTRMRTSLLLESIRIQNELMVAKYAHDIDGALENSQKTVRELITDFRCAIDPAGLLHALQTMTEQFRQRNDIVLEYINRVANLELPLEYEIQVSHIVQEALANIATHSGATHARLIVDLSSNYYVFTIEDNGSGGCTFTPVEGHYGMMIMRERAQRIGGEINVESSKGSGTRVQLFFPEPRSDWRAVNE